jgi:hypothetical protein
VGTAPLFSVGAPVGVHPLLSLTPPRSLGAFAPVHLLVGHGRPLEGPDVAASLHEALERSARSLPGALTQLATLR